MTVTPKEYNQILTTVTMSVHPPCGAGPESQPKSANRDALHRQPGPCGYMYCRSAVSWRGHRSQDINAEHSTDELPRRPDIRCTWLLRQSSNDLTD